MNFKLKSRSVMPPQGWVYREGKTGWAAPHPLSKSFDTQVQTIMSHRAANPAFALSKDKESCEKALEDYTCHRLGNDPNFVDPADAEAIQDVKKNLAVKPSLGQRFATAVEHVVHGVERIVNDAKGAAILTDWLGSGLEPVDTAYAKRRAETCAKCPKNVPIKGIETAVAKAITEQESVREKIGAKLPSETEDKLQSCEVCGCYLKLKVWVPEKHLKEHTDVEEFPANCWLVDELTNTRTYMTSQRQQDREDILDFYKKIPDRTTLKKRRFTPTHTLTNAAGGLGDTLILTDICKASGGTVPVYSQSRHFPVLMDLNPYYNKNLKTTPEFLDAPTAIVTYDGGNGHFTQRLRRLYGLKVDDKPQCQIQVKGVQKKERVILHFDAGTHADWQRQHIHPRARMLYPQNKAIIEKFIKANPQFEYIEVGQNPEGIKGAIRPPEPDVKSMIMTIASAKYFIGIISGPYHVATALGLKVITVINFPDPTAIFLPTLKPITQVEMEWFYPQNVHLHQDGEGKQVKRFSLNNLERAFAGDIYPYWSDEFLNLIHEEI
jgi:hypothetical protein